MSHARIVVSLFAIGAILLGSANANAGTTYFVDADATGSDDGSTWANAFPYLQDALDAASAGDEIWVADGTYYPDDGASVNNNDRRQPFNLIDDVDLYGGFDGTEMALGERDPIANVTILSGDIQQDATAANNSYHVIVAGSTITSSTIVDGFTVQEGYSRTFGGSTNDKRGAGILIDDGDPILERLIIKDNIAIGLASGGGLAIVTNAAPTINKCQILDNMGFGVYNNDSDPEITNCLFTGNVGGVAGGMYNLNGGIPVLVNCTFSGNTVTVGGGIGAGGFFNAGSTSSKIRNSIFWLNADKGIGGTSSTSVEYTCVQGTPVHTGTGNINTDPQFVNTPTDLHLTSASPCRDAGDNNWIDGTNGITRTEDLDCTDRTQDADGDGTATVDMGVYEKRRPLFVVDALATGNHDGSSWANAYEFLQDALLVDTAGDEIWIANGTYRPDEQSCCNDGQCGGGSDTCSVSLCSHGSGVCTFASPRLKTFTMNDGVDWYGGFLKDDDFPDRDPSANDSILDGDIDDDDTVADKTCTTDANCSSHGGECISGFCLFLDFQNYDDNSYHVVTYSTADAVAIMDGVTVRGGAATGTGVAQNQGGGVHIRPNPGCDGNGNSTLGAPCVDSSDCGTGGCVVAKCMTGGPTLRDCVFKENLNSHHGAVNDHAFATVISDCSFIDNLSSSSTAESGALQVHFGSPTVTNCTFTDNMSGQNGGAVWGGVDTSEGCPGEGSGPSFTDCTFEGNIAVDKGGAIYSKDGDPTVSACKFVDNEVFCQGGGAIWVEDGDAVIDGCLFEGNLAESGPASQFGGAIYGAVNVDTLAITDSVFTTSTVSLYGGAIYVTGGTVDLLRVNMVANEADGVGGGLYVAGNTDITVRDSGFIANKVTGPGGISGGGAANASPGLDAASFSYQRCRFIANTVAGVGSGIADFFVTSSVVDSLFMGNQASSGGAISSNIASTFVNNTVVYNTGGGLVVTDNNATVTNSIVWGNSDAGGDDETAQIETLGATPTVTENTIQNCLSSSGGFCEIAGDNNTASDPDFVNPPGDALSGTWVVTGDSADYKSAADVTTSTISDAVKTTFTFATWPTSFPDDGNDLVDRIFQPNADDTDLDGDYTLIVAADKTAKTLTVWGDYETGAYVVNTDTFNVLDFRLEVCTSPAVDAGDNANRDFGCSEPANCAEFGMDNCNGSSVCEHSCMCDADCVAIGLTTCMDDACEPLDLDLNDRITDGDGDTTDTTDMGAYERAQDDCE